MATGRQNPPERFARDIEATELELHGIRARALEFTHVTKDVHRAVVCIAGMGADGRSFVRQRPLADQARILMLNMPPETPKQTDPLLFSADVVEEFLDKQRLERPVLLGSSFGGAVATTVALRRREQLSGLILVGAVLSRWQIPLAFPGFVDLLEAPAPVASFLAPLAAQIMGGMALDKDARDEIVREARHFSGRELKRRLSTLLALDLFPRLTGLRLPVLCIHGRRDWLVPWRRARRAAEAIAGSSFILIPKAGHLPYLSHAPVFNSAVSEFLRALGSPDPQM